VTTATVRSAWSRYRRTYYNNNDILTINSVSIRKLKTGQQKERLQEGRLHDL